MFGKKKKDKPKLEKVKPEEIQKEIQMEVDIPKNLEEVQIKKKIKDTVFYPFHVIIYSKKGSYEYDRDFGVELYRDRDTGNKYLVRTINEGGVKKVVFFEPFPEDEFSPIDIMKEVPKYKKRIKEIETALREIKEKEDKTKKKLSINKKDFILEKIKLKKLVNSINTSPSAQYIVKEKGDIYTIHYREKDGLLIPQKRDFENNTVVVPSENKRASRARQSEINKKIFSQEKNVNWSMIFAWIAVLVLFGLNVWWATSLQDDAAELPSAKINDLRIQIEENNYKSAEEAKKYCNDMYQTFIEDLKRLRNPDAYKSEPTEVNR